MTGDRATAPRLTLAERVRRGADALAWRMIREESPELPATKVDR